MAVQLLPLDKAFDQMSERLLNGAHNNLLQMNNVYSLAYNSYLLIHNL